MKIELIVQWNKCQDGEISRSEYVKIVGLQINLQFIFMYETNLVK